jgi:hypothetical protein
LVQATISNTSMPQLPISSCFPPFSRPTRYSILQYEWSESKPCSLCSFSSHYSVDPMCHPHNNLLKLPNLFLSHPCLPLLISTDTSSNGTRALELLQSTTCFHLLPSTFFCSCV